MNRIDKDTRYWVIRPGIEAKCFENFYHDGCVALGWERIGNIVLKDKYISMDSIKELVTMEYGDILQENRNVREFNRKIGDIASKIYKFIYEVKVGDIILTPGESEVLMGKIIGEPEIISNKYNVNPESEDEKLIGQLNKVRKVQWLKRIDKKLLEPNIKLCLRVVHGISCITQEQVITEINRTIYSFYEYNNLTHSIYRVRNQKEVDFEKYAVFIACLKDVYDIFCEEQKEKLVIKTNVQSPGPIELIGGNNLINKITLAVRFILKNDDQSLKQLGNKSNELRKLKEKSYGNVKDDEYKDYDFPAGGTY